MKAEFIEKDIKIFKPKKINDIENLIEILQEKETSVLVILPDYDKRKCSADDLLNYILSCQTSYTSINVKKFSQKIFICWSEFIDF